MLQYHDSESFQLHMCTKCWAVYLGIEQTGRDEPSREQLPCKRRKRETDVVSFLANSDNEQDGASEWTVKFRDNITISSRKFTQYRDTKNSHDSSPSGYEHLMPSMNVVLAYSGCFGIAS